MSGTPLNENKETKQQTRSSTGSLTIVDSIKSSGSGEIDDLDETLFRLTNGLPQRELRQIISEANECESELLKDIAVLEQALADAEGGKVNNDESGGVSESSALLAEIVQSPLTPLDRYWTVSSVLGRLRDDMTLPSILVALEGDSGGVLEKQLQGQFTTSSPTNASLLSLPDHPRYTEQHDTTSQLLAVWRKISSHRSSLVFKRPVKPEEAPGYQNRIAFPMDLSMIRKMIVARQILSYADLHRYVALISHNCVKFNGRENDYGRVASEFEAAADSMICQAVLNSSPTRTVTTTTAMTPTTQGLPPTNINSTTAAPDDVNMPATAALSAVAVEAAATTTNTIADVPAGTTSSSTSSSKNNNLAHHGSKDKIESTETALAITQTNLDVPTTAKDNTGNS